MLSEEEKKAIEYWKRDIEFYHLNTQLASEHYAQIILNLIEKLQNKIEEKSTIIIAGTKKVKQLEKEIILLKIEKLRAMKQYKEYHLSQTPDTSNIYYSIKLELKAIDEEISNLMRIWENY